MKLTKNHIVKTVYVEAFEPGWYKTGPQQLRSIGEVEKIINSAATPLQSQHGHCEIASGIVAHADLTLGYAVDEVLEANAIAAQGRLRGVRHMIAHDDGLVGQFIQKMPKKHLLMDATFRAGFSQLQSRGLSFDVWGFHHQLEELLLLVDKFPYTTVVVDHVGGLLGVGEYSSNREAVLTQWKDQLRKLAARPNVYLKVGGMGTPHSGFGFENHLIPATSARLAQAWQPLISTCVDIFGTKRCMFESNFPVDGQSCGYTELWNAFKLSTGSMSTDERNDLFYRTASQVYRLDL